MHTYHAFGDMPPTPFNDMTASVPYGLSLLGPLPPIVAPSMLPSVAPVYAPGDVALGVPC